MTAATLEDSLIVAPREEWVLFQNRDKFDLVVLYDASSETYDATGPLSAFVRAVFENAFRKFLRHTPVLLVGGLQAWEQMFSDEVVRGVSGGTRPSPNSILENGISSTSGAILPPASIPDASRNRTLPGSSYVNGVPTEKRLLELYVSIIPMFQIMFTFMIIKDHSERLLKPRILLHLKFVDKRYPNLYLYHTPIVSRKV